MPVESVELESGKLWIEERLRTISRDRKISVTAMEWRQFGDSVTSVRLVILIGQSFNAVPFLRAELVRVTTSSLLQERLASRLRWALAEWTA